MSERDNDPPDPSTPYRVTLPLEGGREITMWFHKPAEELTPIEIGEIEQALLREVKRSQRGKA